MQIMKNNSTRNQQQADAHAGVQRNGQGFERIALQRRKRRAAVGLRIDANAEPRDAVAAEDAQNRREQNDGDVAGTFVFEDLEIEKDAARDQQPQPGEEFSLLQQIRFARFPNHARDVAHGFMHRQIFRPPILHQSKNRADGAHDDAQIHQRQAAHAAQPVKLHLLEAGDFQVRFARVQAAGRAEKGSRD